jgi:hypothetical protein
MRRCSHIPLPFPTHLQAHTSLYHAGTASEKDMLMVPAHHLHPNSPRCNNRQTTIYPWAGCMYPPQPASAESSLNPVQYSQATHD